MTDIARLGFAIDSSGLVIGTVKLKEMTAAAKGAETAAQQLGKGSATAGQGLRQLAGAAEAEARAMQVATTATQVNTRATQLNGASAKAAAMAQRNMIYQLNDVAVSLASGMSVQMVAMQQGSQILQNGVGPAIKTLGDLATGLATKFWPIGLAVGAASAAIAGMQHEINETSKVTVGFGDVALATWQVISSGIMEFIKPATDKIGEWFGAAWDWVVDATKKTGNFIVREIVGAVDLISSTVKSIPDAFIVAGQAAANGFIGGIEWMVQQAMGGIQKLIDGLNSFIDQFGGNALRDTLGWDIGAPNLVDPDKPFTLPRADIGGDAAKKRLEQGWNGVSERGQDIASTDYMGQFFGAVSNQAVKNALAPDDKETAKAQKAAKKMAEAYKDLVAGAQQRIDQSELETQALGMTEEAANRMRYQQELLNKAANDNIDLTPKQVDQLMQLGSAMAAAEENTRRMTEIYGTGKSIFSSFFGDMNSGIEDGKSIWESLGDAASNALDKIANKALEMAANGIWDMIFGAFTGGGGAGAGGGGGGLGSLLGSLFHFANGGQVRGPGSGTSDSVPAMLSNGEFVVNAGAAAKFGPLLEAINNNGITGMAAGGPVKTPNGEADGEFIMERLAA